MDDCDSPYIGLIVLLLFLILHIVLYGFMSAISNLNESSLEKQAKEEEGLQSEKSYRRRLYPGKKSHCSIFIDSLILEGTLVSPHLYYFYLCIERT